MTATLTRTPLAEIQRIAAEFPMRNAKGYVTGFYVYQNGAASQTVAGPFPTEGEAQTERDRMQRFNLDRLSVIAGLVFTPAGSIINDPKGEL